MNELTPNVPRSALPTGMTHDGLARKALDGVSAGVQRVHDETLPRLDAAAARADAAIDQGRHRLHDASAAVRGQVQHASEVTQAYVQAQPLKSVLLAVAGGAVLMAVASMLMRGRRSHD